MKAIKIEWELLGWKMDQDAKARWSVNPGKGGDLVEVTWSNGTTELYLATN